ncbi:hypothetical protein BJ994_003417 [Arthrobacter pigmenti]|uniref:Uncharacterized protein n=1 Tax=Arthrobacter pigmenti TaxID=271432 RepID=A0A846S1N1_9MICC|nr:hypothetical protein [Arthrobacter pigmenti]
MFVIGLKLSPRCGGDIDSAADSGEFSGVALPPQHLAVLTELLEVRTYQQPR